MNSKIILFDFDHTLFDKDKFFEKDLPDHLGVDRKKFVRAYNDFFKDQKTKKVNYDLKKHLDILGIDNIETRKKARAFLKDINRYLKPGALELLEKCQINNFEMFLVTFGNIQWQTEKIEQIKELNKYFNNKHKILLDKDKELALDFLKNKKGEVIIINDKPEESLKMAAILKNKYEIETSIYIVKSIYAKKSDYQGKIYRDLRQLQDGLFSKINVESI